jgi:phage shock protein A
MIELFVIIIVLFVIAVAVFGSKKVRNKVHNTIEDTKKVFAGDPLIHLKNNLAKMKKKLVALEVNTQQLKADLKKNTDNKDNLLAVARIAHEKGNKADSKEAFNLSKDCEKNIESIQADIDANEALYAKMTTKIGDLQVKVNKVESARSRSEARSSANGIRRDIARDIALGDNELNPEALDEVCIEELEANAYEKLNLDLNNDQSLVDKYIEENDDDYEEFINGTDK